jgi:hypothetical protein
MIIIDLKIKLLFIKLSITVLENLFRIKSRETIQKIKITMKNSAIYLTDCKEYKEIPI